jgi:hypothetical protein
LSEELAQRLHFTLVVRFIGVFCDGPRDKRTKIREKRTKNEFLIRFFPTIIGKIDKKLKIFKIPGENRTKKIIKLFFIILF